MKHWPIVGHKWAVRQLQLAVEQDQVPHALLITGPANVGKQTLAHLLVKTMLCQEKDVNLRPCGTCSACRRVESGNHPDFLILEPEHEGRGVKIEQIRDMERFLALTPNESRYKLVIITAFEQANSSAANALLKTLEEPPAYAHLILLAADADTLLPTIVSRTQHIPLRPLDMQSMQQGLMEQWQVSEAEAQKLARLSGGRLGWAVQAITEPDHLQKMQDAFDTLLHLLSSDLPTRFDLADDLAKDAVTLMQTLEYWRTGWRDVLLLQTDPDAGLVYQDYQEALQKIAQSVSLETTAHTLRALGEAQAALEDNANTRLLVETLCIDLPEIQVT